MPACRVRCRTSARWRHPFPVPPPVTTVWPSCSGRWGMNCWPVCQRPAPRNAGWTWAAAPAISAACWVIGCLPAKVWRWILPKACSTMRGRWAARSIFTAGDTGPLPLQPAGGGLIFSSLAVQWCADFAAVLSEAYRVLQPGGVLAFASLCVGTLDELRESWRAADGLVHVNRFRTFETYQQLCAASGFQVLSLERRAHVLHYPDVRSLTHELKALGAHNLNPGRPGGLTGRARVVALIDAYEQFRQAQGLPATYQVVYAVLEKPL